MKIGILGGTFDPFHVAHGYMVEETFRLLRLDKIIVMPNGDPPHKDDTITDAEDRYNMTKIALDGYLGVEVSDFEIKSEKPSYTYKTLRAFKEGIYKDDDLYFILGRDSIINFMTWKEPEKILDYCTLVCFDRPGYRDEELKKAVGEIKRLGGKITILDSLDLEISSTEIRKRFLEGNPIRSFLNKDVFNYIVKKGLYRKK